MMTTLKITRIWLEHIEKIEVEEVRDFAEPGYAQRGITIWTTGGEKYELILEAETAKQLEFQRPEPESWLTPKVYQGTKGEEK